MLLALIICALAVGASVSGKDCEQTTCNLGLIKYYKELNCVPVQESGACCPSKFDCTGASSDGPSNKCHVGGRDYEIGTKLKQVQTGDKCVAECYCADNGTSAYLNCRTVECTEGEPKDTTRLLDPGCWFVYSHDSCCALGVMCEDPNRTAPFTCVHGNQTFHLGEKFYPKENLCMACICQDGYDGTLREPWCKEISCGIELLYGKQIHEGCAPVHYEENGCCPINWRCPKPSDSVTKSSEESATTGSAECVFGNLRLKIGDKLNSEKSCVECKCQLPPMVSCVQTEDC